MITIIEPLLGHLSKSLRVSAGDFLILNDENGRRYHTLVRQITKHTMQTEIQRIQDQPSSCTPLILVQALLKGEKMGWVIQKATELGIHSIVPVITNRSIPRMSPKRVGHHHERWARIALEAAQQSERWSLPKISPLQTFKEFFLAPLTSMPIMLTERVQGESLSTIPLSYKPKDGIMMMVGPEGGWSPEEVAIAQTHHCTLASLGTGILRAETASLTALAILQSRLHYFSGEPD